MFFLLGVGQHFYSNNNIWLAECGTGNYTATPLKGFTVILGFANPFLFVNIITNQKIKMAYRTRTLRKRKTSRRKTSRYVSSNLRRSGGNNKLVLLLPDQEL